MATERAEPAAREDEVCSTIRAYSSGMRLAVFASSRHRMDTRSAAPHHPPMGQRRPKPPEKRSNYITREGFARLRAEFDRLWHEERPRVVQGVADAAAEGDRSENAEYIYGKKKLREIDRKLRHLGQRIEAVNVVEPDADRDDGKVFFGAWVRLESLDQDDKEEGDGRARPPHRGAGRIRPRPRLDQHGLPDGQGAPPPGRG